MVRKIAIMMAAIMGLSTIATAQELTVSGSVTDQTGYPLEGATILVRGTADGTVTDAGGNYQIRADDVAKSTDERLVECLDVDNAPKRSLKL